MRSSNANCTVPACLNRPAPTSFRDVTIGRGPTPANRSARDTSCNEGQFASSSTKSLAPPWPPWAVNTRLLGVRNGVSPAVRICIKASGLKLRCFGERLQPDPIKVAAARRANQGHALRVAAKGAASLDRPCARRLQDLAVGTKECSRRGSNQRIDPLRLQIQTGSFDAKSACC